LLTKNLQGDFILAKNDTDVNSMSKLIQGNEVTLYITASGDSDDTVLSSMESALSRLSFLSPELVLTKQNFIRSLKEKQAEGENRKRHFAEILEDETNKSTALENELRQIRESLSIMTNESAKYKESLKVLVSQFQTKMKELAELKKDRDEKVMLEVKISQLEKELNDHLSENLQISTRLANVTSERDNLHKKASDLELRHQKLEADYLTQSLKFTNLNEPTNPGKLPLQHTKSSSSLPFPVPSDISEVDIQNYYQLDAK